MHKLKRDIMFNLKGKKVLLTGATGGIGKALLELLLKAGANVVISGTKYEALQELSGQVQEQFTDNIIIPLAANLSQINTIDTLIADTITSLGGLDILICNAGLTKDALSMRMKDSEWEEVLKVNLQATFKLNQVAVKKMMKQRYGRIINISSIIAYSGNVGQANYAASKAGIIAMSKSIALEVASIGITVNCIAPGFIDTPMTRMIPEAIQNKICERIPMSRTGKPEEVAAAALFLASDEASYITGSTIHVNGGMLMN